MIVIKNKLSGLYFVGDTLCWTTDFTEASFFTSPKEAETILLERLPNIDINTCKYLRITYLLEKDYVRNKMVLRSVRP